MRAVGWYALVILIVAFAEHSSALISIAVAGELRWINRDSQAAGTQISAFSRVTIENPTEEDMFLIVQLASTAPETGHSAFEKNGERILVVPSAVQLRAISRQVFHIQWVGGSAPSHDQTYELVLRQPGSFNTKKPNSATLKLKLPITVLGKESKDAK